MKLFLKYFIVCFVIVIVYLRNTGKIITSLSHYENCSIEENFESSNTPNQLNKTSKSAMIINAYPDLPAECTELLDRKVNKIFSADFLIQNNFNLRELMNDNTFRFQAICRAPLINHHDFPFHCFTNPCKTNSYYSNGKCVCMDGFENAKINDTDCDECVPKGYREFYNESDELLVMKSPCFQLNNDTKLDYTNVPYPCSSNEINGYTLNAIKLRFIENNNSLLQNVNLFNYALQ